MIALGIVGVLAIGAWIAGERYRARDYLPDFVAGKGELVGVRESPADTLERVTRYDVTLRDDRGLVVRALLQVPREVDTSRTTLLIMAGARTGRRAITYLENLDDYVLLGIDYPYQGRRSKLGTGEFLRRVPRMRRTVLNTPPAAMLAMDYLLRRPEVDPNRVILIGGSLGAIFAPAIGACDERIAAVAILFGAADLGRLIHANVDAPWPLPALAASLGSLLTSPVEPLKYVGRIAPRPLYMLSGTNDERIPEACSRALHAAAGEPRTIRWMRLDHVDVRETELHHEIRAELTAWARENDLLSPRQVRPE